MSMSNRIGAAAVDEDVDVDMDMDIKERNRKEQLALEKGHFWALGGLFLLALIVQCTTIGNHGEGLGGLLLKVSNDSGASGATVDPAPGISTTRSFEIDIDGRSLVRIFQGASDGDGTTLLDTDTDNDTDDDTNVDPINPHNKQCRDYLKNFLEGTTDSNDECQGLQNAYEAADCTEDITVVTSSTRSSTSTSGSVITDQKNNTDANNATTTDDDFTPAIDDFFVEFQCCKVISHYYSSRCLYHQQYASLSLLGIVSVLILCSLVKTVLQALKFKWIPEAGGCILVGAIVGAVLTTKMPQYQMTLGSFNDDLFLFILLPPIIFHASLSIDKKKFRMLLFPIVMFAVVGTFLSAVITGFMTHYLTRVFGSLTTTIPLLDSMIFGALVSSVDPVATLSILHSMGVSETNMLYVVVFGESILNDGVSIAMFESLVMHLQGANIELDSALIITSLKYFVKVSWMSVAIGVGVGLVCTLYFWMIRGRHDPVGEVATFFCFALLAYYMGDGVGGSGIVSIMMAGFIMDIFVRGTHMTERDIAHELLPQETSIEVSNSMIDEDAGTPQPTGFRVPSYTDCRVMFSGVGHISNRAKVHVGFVADVVANLMETAIFAYLGLFLFSNKLWDNVPLVFVGVLTCSLSRAMMVGFVSLFVNVVTIVKEFVSAKLGNSDDGNPLPLEEQQTRTYIDRNMQVILLFSGIRGAVSLALAENIPLYDAVTKHGSHFKPEIKAMTNASIIFTVFIFGASTYYTLKKQREANRNNPEREDGAAMMTSLLHSNSLELTEEHVTPPWINQSQSQI
uniref:Cation/H+ exchanger transmembrane domain-containing protein n=1 Tax=Chaetoceros debilis TaxID=122233 RepID=A0A7S3VBQ4_9STRA